MNGATESTVPGDASGASAADVADDPIAAFYERHPYPPPVRDLDALARRAGDVGARREAHHLVWPSRRLEDVSSILVAGCGTSQAARHALRNPGVRVVGIDVSEAGLDHTRRLAERHGLDNLDLHHLPIERVEELGRRFDHVVCTGVLHHLADPAAGLVALRRALAPRGAITLMVYARYGRSGVHLVQEYCRRLGLTASAPDIAELVATLRELPSGHPLGRLLRETRDFADDGALADALLNPRERSYSVPEVLDLLRGAGLRFGRWAHQAPYLPTCGSLTETPHGARIAELPESEQHAAVELFRGTLTTHTVIAYAADDDASGRLDLAGPDVDTWVPIRARTAVAVTERLPAGAAAALINRAHPCTDLVMFVSRPELRTFRAIDGERTIAGLGRGARDLVTRLWRHDLVVIDASATTPRAAAAARTPDAHPELADRTPGERPAHDVVWLGGGEFTMGSDDHEPEEAPAHRVRVGPYGIDRDQVTNRRFAAFVEATGYVTVAERPLDPAEFPGAPPENLVPGSLVFTPTPGPVDLRHVAQWWTWTPGACWRRPEGPGSGIDDRLDHPVVHVAHEDAAAYAAWAGGRLPTEAEWEHAARGGLDGAAFTWGDEARPGGRIMANVWDGPDFPWRSSGESGFERTAPVGSFPANGFGLHDMTGNAWEWTDDWWTDRHAAASPCCVPEDPRGGDRETSYDPAQPQFRVPRKVVKGGSHLCADSYCLRYRPAARRPQMVDTGMSHVGFRCAWAPVGRDDPSEDAPAEETA